jgi:DNA-binding MarR family transcriptional regulator
VRRAARSVTQRYEAALKHSGLTLTQFTLLQALDRLGTSPQSALVKLLALDATTLSRTLRPLAAAGWIRAADGDDARETRWGLTREGHRRLLRARPAWQRAQDDFRARLGKKKWTLLLDELALVAGVAQE